MEHGILWAVLLANAALGVRSLPDRGGQQRREIAHVEPLPAARPELVAQRVAAGVAQGKVPRATSKTGRLLIALDPWIAGASVCAAALATDILARAGYSVCPRQEACPYADAVATFQRRHAKSGELALDFNLHAGPTGVYDYLPVAGAVPNREEVETVLGRLLVFYEFKNIVDESSDPKGDRFVVTPPSAAEIETVCSRERDGRVMPSPLDTPNVGGIE